MPTSAPDLNPEDVLAPEPQPNQSRRDALQNWKRPERPDNERRLHSSACAEHPLDDIVLNQELHSLSDARWQLASLLHLPQRVDRNARASPKLRNQNPRCRDCILYREVDPHSGDRRHRVRCVSNAEEPGSTPLAQAIDLNRQKLDVVPIAELGHTIF